MPPPPESRRSWLSDAPGSSGFRLVNYILLILALLVLLTQARMIVIAVAIGVGFGVILAPGLNILTRKAHIPRGLAAGLVAILSMVAVGLLGWGLFTMVEAQLASLMERLPELIERLQEKVDAFTASYPWLQSIPAGIDFGSGASKAGTMLFRGAWSGVGVVSVLAFAIVIGLYVAVDHRDYFQGLLQGIPERRRDAVREFMSKAANTVRQWFRAQLLDMLIVGTLTSIGLAIVGAEYWLLLGMLTGLLGIIPYIGVAIVVVVASLLTLAADPARVPWVLAVFLITQQLEGNLILPLVMRGSARLPAAPLLVFMLLMGAWAGLLGILLAPPLFAVLCLAYRELHVPRMAGAAPNDAPGAEEKERAMMDPQPGR